jgi:D-alanine-D-alanine ligase
MTQLTATFNTHQKIDMSSLTIAVLQGGISAEREVSLRSGHNVAQGLRKLGAQLIILDSRDPGFIEELRQVKPDLVFNALHGKYAEDGTIQGLLDILGIPYTGSGVLASALAMDKGVSKVFFESAGLRAPKGVLVCKADFLQSATADKSCSYQALAEHLGTHELVVKPNSEGSSVGVSLVSDEAAFTQGLGQALATDTSALVEECIPGRELTVAVLGDAGADAFALPVVEIIPKTDFYHYDNKYEAGATDFVSPAVLDELVAQACQELAVAAHNALGCQGYSRSDIRLKPNGDAYLLEVNTLPGLTEGSLLPMAAASAGIDLPELLSRIVSCALAK